MIEDLIEIFIEEFQKYNITGICVIVSWVFNQYVPGSKIIKGFLISRNKPYCLHMWNEHKNKISDIGHMYNIRTKPMLHFSGIPQYAIEEPVLLENSDDNSEEFSLDLKKFDPSTYYKNDPKHIKKSKRSYNKKLWKRKKIRFRKS